MSLALIIHPDGTLERREVNGLKEKQAIVGGYIEGVPLNEHVYGYVNDSGKLEELPANVCATNLWMRFVDLRGCETLPGDYVAGPMVIVGVQNAAGENDGHDHDVPEEWLDALTFMVERMTGRV